MPQKTIARYRKVFFLSHPIDKKTPIYGGKNTIVLKNISSVRKGDSCNTIHLAFSSHTGTHMDAPLHFIEKGLSITDFKPRDFIFDRVWLAEIFGAKPGCIIKPSDLADVKDCDLLLIKTGFEKYRKDKLYWRNSPGLDPDCVGWLKEKCPSLRAVGVDFISISSLSNRNLGRKAHEAFLGKGIFLIEDMKLSPLKRKPDKAIVSPLWVDKADGAPCTVFGFMS